jgi:hypothetical protein
LRTVDEVEGQVERASPPLRMDAIGRDIESGALCEADHAVFGRVVRGASGQANEAAQRGTVHIAPPPCFFI